MSFIREVLPSSKRVSGLIRRLTGFSAAVSRAKWMLCCRYGQAGARRARGMHCSFSRVRCFGRGWVKRCAPMQTWGLFTAQTWRAVWWRGDRSFTTTASGADIRAWASGQMCKAGCSTAPSTITILSPTSWKAARITPSLISKGRCADWMCIWRTGATVCTWAVR